MLFSDEENVGDRHNKADSDPDYSQATETVELPQEVYDHWSETRSSLLQESKQALKVPAIDANLYCLFQIDAKRCRCRSKSSLSCNHPLPPQNKLELRNR